MAWPVTDVTTTNLDAGTDSPASARADLLLAAQNVNSIKNFVTVFGQSLISSANLAAAWVILVTKTITAPGTTAPQTINNYSGRINFAATDTSKLVTNSLVTANSVVIATIASNDATMKSVQVVAAAGSFILYADAAATAETKVNFVVFN